MKLTFKERQEVDAIMAAFTEVEHEQVYAEVERIVDPIKHSPVEAAMTVFLSRHYDDIDQIGRAQDGLEAQEMAHKFLWDYVTKVEQQALAEKIWKSPKSRRKVA